MRERINQAIKDAMKSGAKLRLSTLRLVNAAIKDRDIAARVDDKGQSTGRDRIDDTEIQALLQKMIKQRRESIETYRKGNREDLVEQEQGEIVVIEEFLPQQLNDEEIAGAVAQAVEALSASGLKDMGRVMAALKERYTGTMDFAKASAVLKDRLK